MKGRYTIPIDRLQREWAARLARQRMLKNARKGRPARAKTITDNSEPWMEEVKSVGAAIQVSKMIEADAAKHLERWGRT